VPQKLKQYLNRTILASIPALFEDGRCRSYTLLSIEADGLWLSSNELTVRLLLEREDTEPAQPVFVPAVQIAAIILPPPAAPPVKADATPAESGAVPTGATAKAGAPKGTKAAAAQAPSTPARAEKPTR
jgi:hypothetical protein